MKIPLPKRPETFWRRMAATLLLTLWFRQGYGEVWLSQLQQPPFLNPEADSLYWVLQALGIPQILLSPVGSVLLDVSLGLGLSAQCFFPKIRWIGRFNCLSWLLYFVCYYAAFTVHNHGLVGGLGLQLALTFRPLSLGLSGLRYYLLFMHASALGWKLARNTALQPAHALDVLQHQQAQGLSDPSHWVHTVLAYPWLWQSAWYLALLWQGMHLFGFFTRKFDALFFLGMFVFHLGNMWLLDTTFSDVLVCSIAYLPLRAIRETKKKVK